MAVVGLSNGGGGRRCYAFIVVTYPEGSTCTCSNGSKTLSPKDTLGSAVFKIYEAGTWTVSCTDGTNTDTKTVSITSEGQAQKIKLAYETVLFEAGSGALIPFYTVVQANNSSITISKDSIVMGRTATTYCGSFIRSTNALDLSPYSKLQVVMRVSEFVTNYGQYDIGISSNAPTSYSDRAFTFLKSYYLREKGQQTIEVDISDLSTGYFAIGSFVYGTITSIKLIK